MLSVKGSCTLGSDVIIGEDVDFDCSISISEKLALESNDDFVYVCCGSCMSNQKTDFSENFQIRMNLRELKR